MLQLEAVISAANEATQFGICFTQEIDFEFNGDAGMTFVRTVLIHAPSGEQRTSRTPIRSKDPADHRRWAAALHMPSGTAAISPWPTIRR